MLLGTSFEFGSSCMSETDAPTLSEGCGLAETVSLCFCWTAQIVLRLSSSWISPVCVCLFWWVVCCSVLKQQQHCSFACLLKPWIRIDDLEWLWIGRQGSIEDQLALLWRGYWFSISNVDQSESVQRVERWGTTFGRGIRVLLLRLQFYILCYTRYVFCLKLVEQQFCWYRPCERVRHWRYRKMLDMNFRFAKCMSFCGMPCRKGVWKFCTL